MKIKFNKVFIASLLIVLLGVVYLNSSWFGRIVYPIYYKQEIMESAANYQIDPYLIAAIIRVESNYNHTSLSDKGAVGIMQLMPSTASWIIEQGFQNQYTPEDITKVDANIHLGTWYLKWLKSYYNSDLVQIIAAYNAGPGNVDKWIETGIWQGQVETISQIPFGETKYFVQRVLHYYTKYQKLYSST